MFVLLATALAILLEKEGVIDVRERESEKESSEIKRGVREAV